MSSAKKLVMAGVVGAALVVAGISAGAVYWIIGRGSARNLSECHANLQEIMRAATINASETKGGVFGSLEDFLRKELISPEKLRCPSDRTSGTQTVAGNKCSYIWVGQKLDKESNPKCVLAYEPISNHGNRSNFVFVDYTIWPVDAETAKAAIKELEQGRNPPQMSNPQWYEATRN